MSTLALMKVHHRYESFNAAYEMAQQKFYTEVMPAYVQEELGSSVLVARITAEYQDPEVRAMGMQLLQQFRDILGMQDQSILGYLYQKISSPLKDLTAHWSEKDVREFTSDAFSEHASSLPSYQQVYETMGISTYLRPMVNQEGANLLLAAKNFVALQSGNLRREGQFLLDAKTSEPLNDPVFLLPLHPNDLGPYNLGTVPTLMGSGSHSKEKVNGIMKAYAATLDLRQLDLEIVRASLAALKNGDYSMFLEAAAHFLHAMTAQLEAITTKIDGRIKNVNQEEVHAKIKEINNKLLEVSSGSISDREKIQENLKQQLAPYLDLAEKMRLEKNIEALTHIREKFLKNQDMPEKNMILQVAINVLEVLEIQVLALGRRDLLAMVDLCIEENPHLKQQIKHQMTQEETMKISSATSSEIIPSDTSMSGIGKQKIVETWLERYNSFADHELYDYLDQFFPKLSKSPAQTIWRYLEPVKV